MSICNEIDKLWIFLQKSTIYSNRNEQTIGTCNLLDEFHKRVERKKPDPKENVW